MTTSRVPRSSLGDFVSQHTNTKLHTVAETVIAWALRQPLPEPVGQVLDAAVQRRSRQHNAPDTEAGQNAAVRHGVGQGARACSTVE